MIVSLLKVEDKFVDAILRESLEADFQEDILAPVVPVEFPRFDA